jgi:exopolyphosphatase/guanosine-5'-triphosphate,3'-diphosphate pyrophosphatase
LIRHGELLGYSEAEHLMVAAIGRYHRRSLPKKRHESWQLIEDRDQRRMVISMALLLRLAAALDRRPAAVIGALQVQSLTGAVSIALEPLAAGPGEQPLDLSLERWSLRSCADVVQEACGLALRVPEP